MTTNYFSVGGELLKNWIRTMDNIKQEKELKRYAYGSMLLIFIFGAIFGVVLGLYVNPLQMGLNAFKIPMLFIISAVIALPVYYVMDALTGGKKGFAQIAVLLLAATALIMIILVGFVPILLLFIFTTNHYPTIVMLTFVICAIGGVYGIMAFLNGYRHIHDSRNWQSSMTIGGITYIIAGTQFSWVLRPYLNETSGLIRTPRGNFYVDMVQFMSLNPSIAMMFVAFLAAAVFVGFLYMIVKNLAEKQAVSIQPINTGFSQDGPARKIPKEPEPAESDNLPEKPNLPKANTSIPLR